MIAPRRTTQMGVASEGPTEENWLQRFLAG